MGKAQMAIRTGRAGTLCGRILEAGGPNSASNQGTSIKDQRGNAF
jgi:hypothetical protein